jgi:hypothetical protein
MLVGYALRGCFKSVMLDDFGHASKLLASAQNVVRNTQTPELVRFVRTARKEVAFYEREFHRAETARRKLESDPNDPQANTAVGRYLCLAKGRFSEARAYLDKAPDSELAELARLETEKPTDTQRRTKLADGWWAIAEQEKDPARRWARLRAAAWYEILLPSLQGPGKTKAEQRLQEAQSQADAAGLLRWGASLEKMIPGRWQMIWRQPNGLSWTTTTEELDFDADKTLSISGQRRGTWEVQGSEVVAKHELYIDRYKMTGSGQLVAVRFRNGQPYMQGIGKRQ